MGMTQVPINIKGIFGDSPADAAAAYACGWRTDGGKWVRAARNGDPQESPSDGFIRDGRIFVKSAAAALAYDRGESSIGMSPPSVDGPGVTGERPS
jgi:hypothetical protein